MPNIFALYLLTTVNIWNGYDWRYAGEFASEQHCKQAAIQLEIKTKAYRCVDTGRKQ